MLIMVMGCSTKSNEKQTFEHHQLQGNSSPKKIERKTEETATDKALIPVRMKDGYHYVDQKGQIVIKGPFDEARPFSEHVAYVEQNNKKFFIDETGKKVLDVDYPEVGDFHNGLAKIFIDTETQSNYGFINIHGDIMINPMYYYATDFSEGKALAILLDRVSNSFKLYLLDVNGSRKEIKGIEVANVSEINEFSDGLAVVRPSRFQPCYVVNSRGETLSSASKKYDHISSFHKGIAAVLHIDKESKTEYWGYIDSDGREVIKPQFRNAYPFEGNYALVQLDEEQSWAIIDKKGTIMKRLQLAEAEPFSEGLAAVKVNESWGFIDKKGNIVIEPQFTYVEPFVNGLAQVKLGDRIGYINKLGKYVIPLFTVNPSYDEENNAAAQKLSKDEARELVKRYLGITDDDNPNLFIEFDHINDHGDYVFWVYQMVIDDSETKEGHAATIGFFAVDPYEQIVYDER
jgi:hypothetical protein